jgi:tetratricopeptide (TPR) repeat protein
MIPRCLMVTMKNGAASDLAGRREHRTAWWGGAAVLTGLLAMLAGCTPSGPSALRQGQRLIEEGKYEQAVAKLRTAAALMGSTNAQVWNELGLACHHAGELGEAAKAYQRALALNHDLSEARFNLGCLWLAQDKLEAARTEFTAYTLRRPNAAEGFVKLGSVQLRARETAAAEKSYSEALRLDPQNVEALNGLGLTRLARGRTNEAVQCFDDALKQQPDYRPALLNLAIVAHQYLKDHPLALRRYKEYLALKPPPADADALLVTVRQLEQELNPPAPVPHIPTNAAPQVAASVTPPKPAAPRVTPIAAAPKPEPAPIAPKTTAVAPPKPVPTNAPKAAHAVAAAPTSNVELVKLAPPPVPKQGREVAIPPPPALPSPDEPLIVTSSVPGLADEPKPAKRGFFQRINPVNLFRSGEKTSVPITSLGPVTVPAEPVSATAAPPVAQPQPPAPPPAPAGPPARYAYRTPTAPAAGDRAGAQRLFAQGIQAYQAHRLPQAIQAYRAAVQADPSLFEAHYNLGLAAADAGNLPLALSAYETALAVQPASADARYNFALLLKQANYGADAANELEKLLAASPNEARAHLALANLYAQQLHQTDKARQHYLKVLELAPRHPQASAINFWLAANPP